MQLILKKPCLKYRMSDRQTDRQTRDANGNLSGSGKTTHWAVTVYEPQWALMESMPMGIAWYGKQKEICPTTGKIHMQGAIISTKQHRWSGCKGDYKVGASLREIIPGVHIEPASNWAKLLQYCKKEDTRAPGAQYEAQTNSIPNHYQYCDDVGKRVCEHMLRENMPFDTTPLESYLTMIDLVVKDDVASGKRYAAHMGANPNWMAMWKKYAKQYIFSFSNINGPNAQDEVQSGSEDSPPSQGQDQ